MKLTGKKAAVLVGPGYEDLEFWVPVMRLQEEGAEVIIAGIKAGDAYASKSGGLTATAEAGAEEVDAGELDAVVGARQDSPLRECDRAGAPSVPG
jgi:protease I